MIVFDLLCAVGHRFEGWFGSAADYASQKERRLLLWQSVRIHRPSEIVNVADVITVDDVVPGWRLPLSEIFEDD